ALAPLLLQALHLAQVLRADAPLLEEHLLERAVLELHGLTAEHTRGLRYHQAEVRARQSSRRAPSVASSEMRGVQPVSRVARSWLPTMRSTSTARRSAASLCTRS